MTTEQMAAIVSAHREQHGRSGEGKPVVFEASGGLTVESAAAVGATGVDYVAVGAITHSSGILDIALDLRAH